MLRRKSRRSVRRSQVGAHCQGDNATSLGICCVGAGDALPVCEEYMTLTMWDSLLRLVGQLRAAYRVPIARVVGHRERPSGRAQGKTCPGFEVAVMRGLLRREGVERVM